MRKALLLNLILLFIIFNTAIAQELVDISSHTTCFKALELNTKNAFGPTKPPAKNAAYQADVNKFESEQHVTWYKFESVRDGKLLIDIVPVDTLDNYDFLLYKDNGDFCSKYSDNEVQPVRYNFAPCNAAKHGRTGLSATGDNKSYSPSIEVSKGEHYYLAVNNVHGKGRGHSIFFTYLETYVVSGHVLDRATKKPIKAEISWENIYTGELLAYTTSDKNGKFTLLASVSIEAHKFPNYLLSIYSDKFVVKDTVIPSKALADIEEKEFTFTLPKLEKGLCEELGYIFFDPNYDVTYSTASPKSFEVINRVYKMMKKNPKMIIQLEGHTNGYWPSTDIDQKISETRAESVKNILIRKGIAADRILVKGFGSTKLLYPKAKNEIEEGYNRRVEVNIIKLKKI